MKGAKFVVLSMRDIIKNLVFILVGIGILIALFFLFFPSDKSNDEALGFVPGTYTSQIMLKGEPLEIFVTVDDTKITEINSSAINEKQLAYYPLLEPSFDKLAQLIIEEQSTNVELSSESYYTEYVLLNAIQDAISKASAE